MRLGKKIKNCYQSMTEIQTMYKMNIKAILIKPNIDFLDYLTVG